MKKTLMSIIIAGLAIIPYPIASHATTPDQFIGDTAIYGGPATGGGPQPNVLIIIDDSGSMNDPANPAATGTAYAPTTWNDPLPPAAAPNAYPQVAQCYDSTGPFNLCSPTIVYNNSAGNTVLTDVTNLPTAGCTYSTNYHGNNLTGNAYNPYYQLTTTGTYGGPALNADGSCQYCTYTTTHSGTHYSYPNGECAGSSVTYQLGNYINWSWGNPSGSATKISIARDVIGTLIQSTTGIRFGVMTYNYASTSDGLGGTFLSYPISGVTYTTTVKNMDSIFSGTMTNRDALVQALNSLTPQGSTPLGEVLFEAQNYYQGNAPPFGATIGVTSGKYKSPIQYACQKNFVIVVTDGMSNTDYSGLIPQYGSPARYDGGCPNTPYYAYTTCNAVVPANQSCNAGDYDGANNECHSLAGIAQNMYTHDMLSGLPGTTQNNVTTFTIGFGTDAATTEAVDLLNLASDQNHGGGAYLTQNHIGYFAATSAQSLAKALTTVLNSIYQTNTSYVAPVVPVNPENRLQFGSRVYMGFFYPEQNAFWPGNMKKFGLGCVPHSIDPACNLLITGATGTFGILNVIDINNNLATYVDADGNGYDDRDNAVLPSGYIDGSFRPTAVSFWNTTSPQVPDSGLVQAGGVGALLQSRSYAISSVTSNITGTSVRNIYTYTGTSKSPNVTLTAGGAANPNLFLPSNTANITPALLGLPGPIIGSGTTNDVKQLINYVHGFDVYSTATTTNATLQKRSWILGDDLHAMPVVVSYASFTTNSSDETNCSRNMNMIYAGTNDGMLHAFKDCNGSEAWAFIPPDLLPNLQYLTGTNHTYFVDSSVHGYVYLANPNDANPTSATVSPGPLNATPKNDSVLLLVGLRRGGGVTTEPGQGFYYLLDVTDPVNPKYMWTISSATAGFSDLGETWSEPTIGEIAVGSSPTQIQVAAFFGGGYDNCNEDGRFGATQTFSGSCAGVLATEDSGLDGSGNPLTSAGLVTTATFTTSTSYKGRSVYVVKLATLPATSGGALTVPTTPTLIWSYTFSSNNLASYSMLSPIAAVDTNSDGLVDRLYMGDSGGNMWRFNLLSTNTSNWTVTKIFSSNPGYTSPDGVSTPTPDGTTGRKIFYRPAVVPVVTGVVNLYFGTGDREHPLNRAVVDRIYELIDKPTLTTAVNESQMQDVTLDLLQAGTTSQQNQITNALTLASNATNTTQYGWYIRLDSGDRNPQVLCNTKPCPGEKVLSTAAVAGGYVYLSTYSPITAATATTNPCLQSNLGTSNLYALDATYGTAVINYDLTNGAALLRTDRKRSIGTGIPSSAVVVCDPGNTACQWLIGCGGGVCSGATASSPGALVSPIYWRRK